MDDAWMLTAGDTGPWSWHIPTLWHAVADPARRTTLPPRPLARSGEELDHGLLERSAAWWSPLLQVLLFGCGWPRPDLGLAAWLEAGRPTADARLDLVDRWWRTHVLELLVWSRGSVYMHHVVERVAAELGTPSRTEPLDGDRLTRLLRAHGHAGRVDTWGNDSMHLTMHLDAPLQEPAAAELVVGTEPTSSRPGRAVLMAEGYAGWYRALHEQGAALPHVPGTRAWHVDVVCRPIGWLGTYRWSAKSGRWFAGRHRWHDLGISS